ncbi:MAG: MFS transporter [Gordonibacter sp.]|uniref:MFS transporter n=1 Tax=Gordonibacter sp. TaxID=1968902 RepID=UPI002FCB30FA
MNMKQWLVQPQRKLGPLGLVVLLVVSSLVTPLSLDMYTPAVPHMAELFSTSTGMVNLTLVGYFLFFAVGLLLFGPVSDRYGRRPVLLAGVLVYTVGSAFCALSLDIWMFIFFRVVQALGAGAVSAVATAIVKDAFVPQRRAAILSLVQIMFVIGPVLAPFLGALIMQVVNWRMTFVALGAVGVGCCTLAVMFEETLPAEKRFEGSVFSSLGRLGVVARNKGFASFLGIVGLFNLPFMAYIAVGSYIYISFFGLSEIEYSLFFAAAALLTAAGPVIWLKVSKHISARRFTSILLAVALGSGAAMLLVGELTPVLFCLTFLVFAMTEACVRPYSTDILLSQQESDAGAASSLINFAHTAIGCVGMALAVLPWPNYVVGVGSLVVVTMAFAGICWIALLKSRILLPGIKDDMPKDAGEEAGARIPVQDRAQ